MLGVCCVCIYVEEYKPYAIGYGKGQIAAMEWCPLYWGKYVTTIQHPG